MTKPIVALYWVKINGRYKKQQNTQPQTEARQPSAHTAPKPIARKLRDIFRRGDK